MQQTTPLPTADMQVLGNPGEGLLRAEVSGQEQGVPVDQPA